MVYHGMAARLSRVSIKSPELPNRSAALVVPCHSMAADPALIHHLANMVLTIQTEVQHVY